MMGFEVDVCVVGYRPGDETKRLLDSLGAARGLALHYRDNTGNPSTLSAAWNDLAWSGSAPFVAFLNSDVAVPEGWHRRLSSCFERMPDIGAALPVPVGAPIVQAQGRTMPGAVGNPPSSADMIRVDAWCAAQFGETLYDFGAADPAAFYAVMVRRSVFEALRGFDERLRFYGQDHEFQERLRMRRLRTVRVMACPAWHGGSIATKTAIQAGEIDVNEEYRHFGRVLVQIRTGMLKRWDALGAVERGAVRNDPQYRMSRGTGQPVPSGPSMPRGTGPHVRSTGPVGTMDVRNQGPFRTTRP